MRIVGMSNVVVCIATLAFIGCGGGPEGPELVPVKGQVVLDGQPVPGATVTFTPDNAKDTQGPASIATTDDQGAFTVYGTGGREGVIVGFHKVTVETPPVYEEMGSSPDGAGSTGTGAQSVTIPANYRDVATTPLAVEVKPEGNDKVVLELTSGS